MMVKIMMICVNHKNPCLTVGRIIISVLKLNYGTLLDESYIESLETEK